MTDVLPLSSRLYTRLLAFYPEDLRRDYGADMALVFAEDLTTAHREVGMRGVIRVWWCALGEFARFALPGHLSSPAVRVPAITLAMFIATTSGMTTVGLWHAQNPSTLFPPLRAFLLLPLFSTPLISLIAVWSCRHRTITSLDFADHPSEEQ